MDRNPDGMTAGKITKKATSFWYRPKEPTVDRRSSKFCLGDFATDRSPGLGILEQTEEPAQQSSPEQALTFRKMPDAPGLERGLDL
jgi:hypothetical protein